MRYLRLIVLLASGVALATPAVAQTTGQSGTPAANSATAPGTGPDRTREQLCDNKPCEDPAQQRDLQKLHAQDMDWLENHGPAAGGTPGDAQKRGPHGPSSDNPKGGSSGTGRQGPGPH